MIWIAKSKRSLMLWWVLVFFLKKFLPRIVRKKGCTNMRRKNVCRSLSPGQTDRWTFDSSFVRWSAMPCYTKSKQIHGCCFSVDAAKRMRNIKIAELSSVVIVFSWFTFKTRTLDQTQATQCEYDVLSFFFLSLLFVCWEGHSFVLKQQLRSTDNEILSRYAMLQG